MSGLWKEKQEASKFNAEMWVAYTATQGHGGIRARAVKGHVWVCNPTISRGCVDARGSCYHKRPWGYQGSRLPPEAMSEDRASTMDVLIWVTCAVIRAHGDIWAFDAAEGHIWGCGCATAEVCVDVCRLFDHLGPCESCIEIQVLYLEDPALCWSREIWPWPSLAERGNEVKMV